MTTEEIVRRFAEAIRTPEGARYIARRIGAKARAELKETLRLEAWFLARPATPR